MLRVLIERPSVATGDVNSGKKQFHEVARRHPDVARRMKITFCGSDVEREQGLASAEIFVAWRFPKEDLARRAPHLKWIQLTGAGVEHLMPLDWLPAGVTLTNCSGVHGPKVAESAMLALLSLHAKIPAMMSDQRAHHWGQRHSSLIEGKTVIVVGTGGLGTAAMQSARRLGLKVIAVNRSGEPHKLAERTVKIGKLKTVLPKADFVFLTAPSTTATRGMMSRAEFAAMKPGSSIANFGRGALVDEPALIEALKSGHLSGAFLDVFAQEPLPADSSIWDVPNLFVSPHVLADDADNYMPRNFELFLRNAKRYMAGKPLMNRIDPMLEY
jgi:phosphoglycerate dehydrogenase-like enzyme